MREKNKWLELIALHTVGRRPKKPLKRAAIRIVRCSAKAPDFDGMAGSGKFLIDPLVKLGILIDDNMEIIGQPEYAWVKAKRGEGFVEIFVNETGPDKI